MYQYANEFFELDHKKSILCNIKHGSKGALLKNFVFCILNNFSFLSFFLFNKEN